MTFFAQSAFKDFIAIARPRKNRGRICHSKSTCWVFLKDIFFEGVIEWLENIFKFFLLLFQKQNIRNLCNTHKTWFTNKRYVYSSIFFKQALSLFTWRREIKEQTPHLTLLYCSRTVRSSHRRCSIRKLFLKISQYPQETPVSESICKKVADL